jgi:hypothetical protein
MGPGPAKYSLRDQSFDATGKCGVVIKGAHEFNYDGVDSPGPGTYKPNFGAIIPTPPKFTFHERSKLPGAPETPGYHDLGSTLGQSLKWTMKQRALDDIAVV